MDIKEQLSPELLKRLFLVTGRVPFDDDDTVYIVEASDIGTAQTAFSNKLEEDSDLPDNEDCKEIIITGVEELSRAISDRIVTS